MRTFKKNRLSIAIATVGFATATPTYAAGSIEEVVVTAAAGGRSVLDSSVAVTGVSSDLIKDFQPSSEGEIYRMIPGIQTAGTAGPGGNANIAVRGLPVATGGSPFIQIQEDGLPTVLFGDIQFGNGDYWTKFDATTRTVEGIRGGTAGVYTSQAPAAILNYVSYTGKEGDGGFVQFNTGIGFDENKIDFRYGASGDTVDYHIGGFVRNGEGPLDIAGGASDSYQVKANLTKHFDEDKGYIRFLTKVAETHEANYTSPPARANINVDGNGNVTSVSGIKELPGFDGRDQSSYSAFNSEVRIVNRGGDLVRVPVDGISSDSVSFGTELNYVFTDNLKVDNKMRQTSLSGTFTSPFTEFVPTGNVIGSTVNGEMVDSIFYFNGPNAGQPFDGEYVNVAATAHTDMRDFGSFVNDLVLTGEFELGGGDMKVRAGYFYMDQTIAMSWHSGAHISELNGDNAANLSLYDSSDNLLTAEGNSSYNAAWGAKDYNLSYLNTAPYLVLDFDNDLFQVDAGYRWENVAASGWAIDGGEVFSMPVSTLDSRTGDTVTVNMDTQLHNGSRDDLDYEESYESWTVGGLWKVADSFNVFARVSEGGRFNADRQAIAGNIGADGKLNAKGLKSAVDFLKQWEIGIKGEGDIGEGGYTVEFTLLKGEFSINTIELNQDVCGAGNLQCEKSGEFETQGFELGATYFWRGLSVTANATYTDAEENTTVSTQPNASSGFVRAAQIPDLSYTLLGSYEINEQFTVGLNLSAQTDVLSGGRIEYPGNELWGANFKYRPVENLEIGLNVYNLLDDYIIRSPGGIRDQANGIIDGGTALGRTTRASIKVLF